MDNIQLENIPSSADIEPGDMLVTSGLGGVFPEGYPVAKVTSFSFDNKRPFAQVDAKPEVQFDRLRYLLLVWPTDIEKKQAAEEALDATGEEPEAGAPEADVKQPAAETPAAETKKEVTNG